MASSRLMKARQYVTAETLTSEKSGDFCRWVMEGIDRTGQRTSATDGFFLGSSTILTWILYIFSLFFVFSANMNVICTRIHKPMAKKRFRITEKDFLLANRKASREEEIAKYGKQIMFRTTTQKSKKVYDRKRLKKAGINSDDLPLMIFSSLAEKHSFL